MELSVKKMTDGDVINIAALEKATFTAPWSEKVLIDELTNPTAHFFCAFCEGVFAGYIGSNIIDGEVYIGNVAVKKEYRRLGIAGTLLNVLQKEAEKHSCKFITLEVRQSNVAAISLYEKNGYVNMGVRPGFYEQPKENAVIMTKFL